MGNCITKTEEHSVGGQTVGGVYFVESQLPI